MKRRTPVHWGVFMSVRVALLCSILALSARAQSLSLQGAPLSLRLGGRTQGLTVERRDANGLPVTGGNTMAVVTAPPGGQVSLNPEPFSSWGPMVTASILPGGSQSAPFYLRGGVRGLSSWSVMAPGYTSAVATVWVRDDALTCNFESGKLLDTDVPPGCFNVSVAPYAQSSMTSSMSAAHRGSFGVRLIDGEASMGNAADTSLFDDTAPTFGDFSARSWVRVVATNGLGAPIIAQLTNGSGQSPSLIDIKLRPNLDLVMGGFAADAGYSELVADSGLSVGSWHLLEFAVTGAGTSDGGRAVWLDGRLMVEQRSVDFSGTRMSVGRLALGEPYADDRRWLGTIDFDDVRSAGVPLASRLELQVTDGGMLGECLPLAVQLRSSLGGALTAPGELVPIQLDAGGAASLFVDPSCAVPGDQVVMLPDASVTTLSFRASQLSFVIAATTPDFLSTPRAVTLRAPSPDAGEADAGGTDAGGTDAGEPDAGEPDAGEPDAGEPDAGEPDAGEVDAGLDQPRALEVGCGCSTSGVPSLVMLLLAWVAMRRSRLPTCSKRGSRCA